MIDAQDSTVERGDQIGNGECGADVPDVSPPGLLEDDQPESARVHQMAEDI